MEDIHKYLKGINRTKCVNLNSNTILYLIEKHNYTSEKLEDYYMHIQLIHA